jgi:hypothetical protein
VTDSGLIHDRVAIHSGPTSKDTPNAHQPDPIPPPLGHHRPLPLGGKPSVQGHQVQQHLGAGGVGPAAGSGQCNRAAAAGDADAALDADHLRPVPAGHQRADALAGGEDRGRLQGEWVLDGAVGQPVHLGVEPGARRLRAGRLAGVHDRHEPGAGVGLALSACCLCSNPRSTYRSRRNASRS